MLEQKSMLDESVFYRYVSVGDEQMRAKIIELFQGQVEQYVADMEIALRDADLEAVGRVLHKMKGTTAFIGAAYLHDVVQSLMSASDGERLDRLRNSLNDIKAGLQKTVAAMRSPR